MESTVIRVISELHSVIFDECNINLDKDEVKDIFRNGYRYFYGYAIAMKKDEIGEALNKAVEISGVHISDDCNIWMHIRSGNSIDDLAIASDWLTRIYSSSPILSSIQDESLGEKVETFIVLSKED